MFRIYIVTFLLSVAKAKDSMLRASEPWTGTGPTLTEKEMECDWDDVVAVAVTV